MTDQIQWNLWRLGMQVGNPPSVSGWPAYYQAPVYDLFWINSKTIQDRVNLYKLLTKWGLWMEDGDQLVLNSISYILTYQSVDDLDALIQELANRFLGGNVPLKTKDRIKQNVLNGVNESYWTDAVNDYKNNPTLNSRNDLDWRFQELLSKLFQLGEINLF